MKFSITLALIENDEAASIAESIQNSKNFYLNATVNDGKELLSVLSENETDLVIMDSTLPTYDALSILSFTRNLIRRPIFAVLCEYPIRNDQIFLSEAGSDLIFYKPVLCEALLRSCLPYCTRSSWELEFPHHKPIYSLPMYENTYSRMDTASSHLYPAFNHHTYPSPAETSPAVAESVYVYGRNRPFSPEVIPNESISLPDPLSADPAPGTGSILSDASRPYRNLSSPVSSFEPQPLPDPAPSSTSRSEVIENFLRSLGFPATRKGFLYLQYALDYILDHSNQSPCGKTIYQQIVSVVDDNTRETAVERAIRNSIDKTWENGDLTVLNRYFPQNRMPENSRHRINGRRRSGSTGVLEEGTRVLCPTNIFFMVECAKHIRTRLSSGRSAVLLKETAAILTTSDPKPAPFSETEILSC